MENLIDTSSSTLQRFCASPAFVPFLRGIGVYVKNYSTGETIPNRVWRDLGYGAAELSRDAWKRYVHPEDRTTVDDFEHALVNGRADVWEGTFRLIASDGSVHWVKHKSLVLERDISAVPTLYIGWDEDVTDIAASLNEERKRSQEVYDRLMRTEAVRSAGIILSAGLDPKETAEQVLAQAKKVLNFDRASVWAVQGDKYLRLSRTKNEKPPSSSTTRRGRLPLSSKARRRVFSATLANSCPTPTVGQLESGSFLEAPLVSHGEVVGFLEFCSYQTNAYENEDVRAALIFADHAAVALDNALRFKATEKAAETDWLTGLATRRSFLASGARLRAKMGDDFHCAVLMIDVDHFKGVNDRFGHAVGDKALRLIAELCVGALRSVDLCCRYGGEEIAVLLPGATASTGLAVAERIRERINRTSLPEYPDLSLSISAGIAESSPSEDAIQKSIDRADFALYKAKETGRNRCCVAEGLATT